MCSCTFPHSQGETEGTERNVYNPLGGGGSTATRRLRSDWSDLLFKSGVPLPIILIDFHVDFSTLYLRPKSEYTELDEDSRK